MICYMYLVWNMKHSGRSLKLNINDKSKRNCSGLSSGISGAASIWPLITIISSLVAWLALTWPRVSKSITELSKLYMQFSNSWISKCLDLINMPTFWLRLASSSLATDTFAAFSSVFFLSSFFALGLTYRQNKKTFITRSKSLPIFKATQNMKKPVKL